MASDQQRSSTWNLLLGVVEQSFGLIDAEARMLRTEVGERGSLVARACAMLAVCLVLGIATLVIVLQTAIAGLVYAGLQPAIAGLIVSIVALVLVAALAMKALSDLRVKVMKPMSSFSQLQKDFNMMRGIRE